MNGLAPIENDYAIIISMLFIHTSKLKLRIHIIITAIMYNNYTFMNYTYSIQNRGFTIIYSIYQLLIIPLKQVHVHAVEYDPIE